MYFSGTAVRKILASIGIATMLEAIVATFVGVSTAAAAPADQCSASAIAGTVSSVTAAAHQYLDGHPGANQAVTAAINQSRPDAEANLRGYFTANPSEYRDIRAILTPLGDTQRTCNVSVLPGDLQSAYDTFMSG